jgi:DNA invertase Pin-like site-specific DNA recombinase
MTADPNGDTAILVRISLEEKGKRKRNVEGHSLKSQEDWGRRVCRERDWRVYNMYVQDGGHSDEIYPQLERLLRDVSTGKVKRVVTEYYDRLARGPLLYTIVMWLKDWGVSFHSSDLSDDIGQDGLDALLGTFSGSGRIFLRKLREKTREGMAAAKMTKHVGRNIAGFVYTDGHWSPDPSADGTRRAKENLAAYRAGGEIGLLASVAANATASNERRLKTAEKRARKQQELDQWLAAHRPLSAYMRRSGM